MSDGRYKMQGKGPSFHGWAYTVSICLIHQKFGQIKNQKIQGQKNSMSPVTDKLIRIVKMETAGDRIYIFNCKNL